ncbi:MAG TPA: phytanoyl-CoA dioxygenase family protein [Caulobacteraceae bacterium]|nr:phytanoyl-CoA dioxygenase family protein [Caulobacteraceae bacterium]
MKAATLSDPKTPFGDLLRRLDADGYLLFPGILIEAELGAIRAQLDPVLQETPRGRNDFEGFTTKRVYALLHHAPATAVLVEHPMLMAVAEQLLEPTFLLSAHLAIQIFDGETAQSWHFDDGFYRHPMPRGPDGVSAIWALDAFTEENGATEIIPGSHKWGPARPAGFEASAVKAIAPAGSLLVFPGNLTHRGGANTGAPPRLAVTTQFCQGWHRQQENMMVSVGEGARDLSPCVQALIGYSIHPPFLGQVDGLHPLRLIENSGYVGIRRRGLRQPLGSG